MATSFPTSLDSLTNPTNADKLNNPDHAQQHANANDAIEVIEAKLGIGASTPTNNTFFIGNGSGTSAYSALTSAQLAARVSDETGTGVAVFNDTPTILTPTIASLTNAQHTHLNAAGGGLLGAASVTRTNFDTAYTTEINTDWKVGVLPAQSGTIVNNGNRSYDVPFASTVAALLTPGMRVRTSRTVAAPTQSTSLNGTTQYYSKASPNKLTFTDDFVVSAWVKVAAYTTAGIVTRYNGTSGWMLRIESDGRISLIGFNAGAANTSQVSSYQSVPLNKWVHVTAQLDMSTFTATTTTSYVMVDGIDVPATVTRAGTNPTALIQAGSLEIGSYNGGTQPLNGKIAQVAIYNAKVTQANIRLTMSQTLSGSETSIASAYSFNNVITDLNTGTPNDLTPNGSAVATNADSPFTVDANGVPGGTYDFGIVTKVATTVATVQVPEGCAIPTSGGVSAVDYATTKSPFGMPILNPVVQTILLRIDSTSTSATATAVSGLSMALTASGGVPYKVRVRAGSIFNSNAATNATVSLWDGTVGSGTQIIDAVGSVSAANYQLSFNVETPVIFASGAKTYNIGLAASAGTTTLRGTAITPVIMELEYVGIA